MLEVVFRPLVEREGQSLAGPPPTKGSGLLVGQYAGQYAGTNTGQNMGPDVGATMGLNMGNDFPHGIQPNSLENRSDLAEDHLV